MRLENDSFVFNKKRYRIPLEQDRERFLWLNKKLKPEFFDELFEFFYNAFKTTSYDRDYKYYRVFVARRCFVLGCHFLRLFKGIDEFEVDYHMVKKTIYTDGGLRILASQMANDFYKKISGNDSEIVKHKICLYDDILIHGRSIAGILSAAEEIFADVFLFVSQTRINDIEVENELKNIFLDSISIKTEFINLQPSLLSERYKEHICTNEDSFLQADQWRERSYFYSKTIFESDIPNAAFIPAISLDNLCARDDLHNAFISRLDELNGFEFDISKYKGRSLYVYHKDVVLNSKLKAVLSLRCTDDYIIPFVFLPSMSTDTFARFFDYIFYRIGITHDSIEIETKYSNLLFEWLKIKELSVMLSELLDLVLSVSLLRAFLDALGIQIKGNYEDYISFDMIRFNYAHNDEISEIVRSLLSPDQRPVFSLNEINKLILFFTQTDNSFVKNRGGSFSIEKNTDRLINELEDFVYKNGIESEKAAYQLSIGSLNPSLNAIEYFTLPYDNSIDRFFRTFKKNSVYKADFSDVIDIFLQFMDWGCFAITTGIGNNRFIHCVRTGEQSLMILPVKYAEFLPILIEMEKRCFRQDRVLQLAFTDEFEDFFRLVDYYYEFSSKFEQELFYKLEDNKTQIKDFVKGIYDSGQKIIDYDFVIDIELSDPERQRQKNKEFFYKVIYY